MRKGTGSMQRTLVVMLATAALVACTGDDDDPPAAGGPDTTTIPDASDEANDCLTVHDEVLDSLGIDSGGAAGPRGETPLGAPVFFIATSDGALWLTNRDPSAGLGLALPLNEEARATSEVGVDVPSDAPAYGDITAESDGAAQAVACAQA